MRSLYTASGILSVFALAFIFFSALAIVSVPAQSCSTMQDFFEYGLKDGVEFGEVREGKHNNPEMQKKFTFLYVEVLKPNHYYKLVAFSKDTGCGSPLITPQGPKWYVNYQPTEENKAYFLSLEIYKYKPPGPKDPLKKTIWH